LFVASLSGLCDVVKCLLSSGANINLCDEVGHSPLITASRKGKCAPELSKHLTTSHFPFSDAAINGEVPCFLHKLISAPKLSKHLTTSQCPANDASNNGDLPSWSISICVTNKEPHH
jgi:hypothetical protein